MRRTGRTRASGTFTANGHAVIASALIYLGMDCEKLSARDEAREGAWVSSRSSRLTPCTEDEFSWVLYGR